MEVKAPSLHCYSRLWKVLSERHLSVTELQRALGRRGVRVNVKTLYRLADPTSPIERLDMAIAGEICAVLKIDLSRLVSFESVRRETGLQKMPPSRQRRLDSLLEEQAEGRLSGREREELSQLVDEAERLTLRNARTLARARQAASRV